MICKDNQTMIDNLLRLKVDEDRDNGTNNKIASYQYQDWKTRKANEAKCVSVIKEIMNANQTQNKVASVQSTRKIGEVAEFQSLLKRSGIH
jgi:hypothetical protein